MKVNVINFEQGIFKGGNEESITLEVNFAVS
ncbi:hypothetical protein PTD2_19667 [Pseudoalteromonas tunicata D2]|jgi:hypothetical protein|uniref:Uncharacterized protein n=1 Tax=Pseudoalteromonas tunicata D2 TaxID=87626 RepID=A4C9K9_9GAMM|nr:hypothetical protein PTD2_19667 [Pseudoalteromonas tunicata D2]